MELKKTRVTVTEVINAGTFKVTPHWQSTGKEEGDTIKINGYTAPEPGQSGFQKAKDGLESIIRGKDVELKNPKTTTGGQLVCDVMVEGKNITTLLNR